jgi:sec-independent protein translocase protein TatC
MSDHDFIDPLVYSRMSLGDHIEELRRCLWRAIAGLLAGVVIGFFISQPAFEVIAGPINRELRTFYSNRRQAIERRLANGDPVLTQANLPREMPLEIRRADLSPALASEGEEWVTVRARIRPVSWELMAAQTREEALARHGLTGLTMTEPFLVYFKVSLYAGIVLASPWIFHQLWTFIAAGLYAHERRLVHLYLPLSIALFLGGVALCEFVVLPLGVAYLLSYYEWMGAEPAIRLGDWLSFALLMPLVFGISFQTPLVMMALERIGLADADFYRRHRRMAIFLLAIVAAVISVTPDWVNMLALAVPLWGLYELGIWLCVLAPGSREEDSPDSEPWDFSGDGEEGEVF